MTYVSGPIRNQVRQRANGRCEYCGKPEDASVYSHQVDHVVPPRHGGSSATDNLAWACFRCNNLKGTDVASYDRETGELTPLYNPRTQVWIEHFRIEQGVIIGITPIGRVTVQILKMNHPKEVEMRQHLIEAGVWDSHGDRLRD